MAKKIKTKPLGKPSLFVRKMPESIYCGSLEVPNFEIQFYFPKDIKNGFNDSYDSNKKNK